MIRTINKAKVICFLLVICLVLINKPKQAYANMAEVRLLAEVMYYENYSNGIKAMLYTGSVVLNRANDCSWCPDTVKDVLYQKGQYSTTGKFFTRKIPFDVYLYAIRLDMFGSVLPAKVVYQSMFKQGSGVYEKVGTDYFCYE